MAFLAPVGAALASGTAAIGGASTLTALATGVSVIGGLAQARFQGQVADNQAQLLEQQATQARQRGEIEQQETDFAALAEISRNQARRAGSGFELGSTSFNRARRVETLLARRDALRVRDNAEREALSLQSGAATAKAESQGAKRAGLFNAVGGAFTFGSDLIGSATLANKKKTAQLGLKAV